SKTVEAVKLGTETVTPVCSAQYARDHRLRTPEDLYNATLMCGDIPENWPAWFAQAGCDRHPSDGPRLGDDGAILQAAVDGQGVALGRSLLVKDDIAAGRLVSPFETTLDASHAYWFVSPTGIAPKPALDAVGTWLARQFVA
ncbi:MAG: LysR substrate-binding domain-containing protein, partial [Pseudomonadota bacterium]